MTFTPSAQTQTNPAGMPGAHPQGQYETDVADPKGGVGVAAEPGLKEITE